MNLKHPDCLETVYVGSLAHMNADAIRELRAPLLIVKTQGREVEPLAVIVPIAEYERMIANERPTGITGEPESSH